MGVRLVKASPLAEVIRSMNHSALRSVFLIVPVSGKTQTQILKN